MMGRKALIAVIWCMALEGFSARAVRAASEFADNVSDESAPRAYRYAGAAPLAAYSFHAPRVATANFDRIVPLNQERILAESTNNYLRDSYGQRFVAAPQTYAYRAALPQQFVPLQQLPAHLSQPLAAAGPGGQATHFFGAAPADLRAGSSGHSNPFAAPQPLVYAQNVRTLVASPASKPQANGPYVVQQQSSIDNNAYVNFDAAGPFNQFWKAPQAQALQEEPKISASANQEKQQIAQSLPSVHAPQQTTITSYSNGKKTVANLITKPPVPHLLDLTLLEPLTFDNPLVPQVQHFLPKIHSVLYTKLPEVVIPKVAPKNNQKVITIKTKTTKKIKKQKKPTIATDDDEIIETPTVNADDNPEFSYEINSPNYKETYTEKKVSYNTETKMKPIHISYEKKTEMKPVSYSYGKITQKEPVHYNFVHNSNDPAKLKQAYLEQNKEKTKHLIYHFSPEELSDEQNEQSHNSANPTESVEIFEENPKESENVEVTPQEEIQHQHQKQHTQQVQQHQPKQKHQEIQNHQYQPHHEPQGQQYLQHDEPQQQRYHQHEKPQQQQYVQHEPRREKYNQHEEPRHQQSLQHEDPRHQQYLQHEEPDHQQYQQPLQPQHQQYKQQYQQHREPQQEQQYQHHEPQQKQQYQQHHEPQQNQQYHHHHAPQQLHAQQQQQYQQHSQRESQPQTRGNAQHELAEEAHNEPNENFREEPEPEHIEVAYYDNSKNNLKPEHRESPYHQNPQNAHVEAREESPDSIVHRPSPQNEEKQLEAIVPEYEEDITILQAEKQRSPGQIDENKRGSNHEHNSDADPHSDAGRYDYPESYYSSPAVSKEKSNRIIIKDDPPQSQQEIYTPNDELMKAMVKKQEESEEDFESAYKDAAYGFPAYDTPVRNTDREKEIYNPANYGVPRYRNDFDDDKSQLRQYEAAGDPFPAQMRSHYKDAKEKTSDDYYKGYSENGPQSLVDRKKKKDEYYDNYNDHSPQNYFGKEDSDKQQSAKFTVGSYFSYPGGPPQQYEKFTSRITPLDEYNYAKEKPDDSSAFGTGYAYAFEPRRAARLLQRELAAMASDHSPETVKKVYTENYYIEKSTTSKGEKLTR